MKKITYLFTALFLVAIGWQSSAQIYLDEDFTGQALPTGWTNVDNGATAQVWEFNNPFPRTIDAPFDTDFAILDSDNYGSGGTQDATLTSAAFDASGGSSIYLSFDQQYRVCCGSTASVEVYDGTTWNAVYILSSTSVGYPGTTPDSQSIDITAACGLSAVAQVRFNYAAAWDYWWAVDNVLVQEVTCAQPNTLAVSAIVPGTGTDGTATVSWVDGNASSVGFDYELVDVTGGGTPTGTPTGSTGTNLFVDLTGLTLGSEYQLLVRADCGLGSFSSWASINFFMIFPPTCTELPIVPADAATGVTFGSTLLTWTEDTSGGELPTGYQIWFGQTSGALANLATIAAPATGINITGILANTTYYWRIVPENAGGEATGCAEYSYTTKDYPAVAVGVDCSATGNNNNNVFTEEFDAQGLWTGTFNGGGGTWILPQSGATGSSDTGPDTAYSGSNYMFYEASGGGARASAVTPAIDLTAATGGAELSFFMHAYGYEMGTFEVGVSTAGAGGPFTNEFAWDGAMQVSGAEAWRQVGVNLDAYVGQTIHIELANTGTGGFHGDMSIDLFNVETCLTVSCAAPSAMVASSITTTSASLDWTENGSATIWDLEIGLDGFAATGTPTDNDITKPFPATGLTSGTAYDVYYRADCGLGSQSTWTGPFSFTTESDYCGLDNFYDTGGPGGDYSNNENITTTILPDTGGDVVTATFLTFGTESCCDSLEVFDGDTTAAPSLGVFAGTTIPGPFTSTHVTGALTFLFNSDSSVTGIGWDVQIDCASPPTCIEPINLAVANLTTINADISWDPEPTESNGYNWEIHIVPGVAGVDTPLYSGSTATGVTTDTSVGPFVPGTSYTLYVQTNCGLGGNSTWGFVGFALPFGGDDCANAEVITPGAWTGTTINSGTAGGSTGGRDAAWFSFTPTTFGTIDVSSCLGGDDTTLWVWDGACGALNAVASSGDICEMTPGGNTWASEVTGVPVIAGTEYFIEWDDQYSEGPFDWSLVFTPTCSGITTTWDGVVWDNGAPTSNDVAVINGLYQTSVADLEACVISINAGHTIIVDAGTYVRAQNDMYVAGDLFVLHEGSVVQVDDTAATVIIGAGLIDVQKSTPLLTDADFSILGSPMTAETREGVYGTAAIARHHVTGNFAPFANGVPAADNWADDNGDNWLTHTGTLVPGAGYLVKPQLTGAGSPAVYQTVYNLGTLNNGIVTVPTILNPGGPAESPNILSNPYASAISISAFLGANLDAGGAVYFWEHATAPAIAYPGYYTANYDMGDISSHNGTIGTAAVNGGVAPTNEMPSGQGFGVKVTVATDITFNNAMRVTGPNTGYRNSQIVDELHLTVSNETYHLNGNMALGFTDFSSDAIERSDVKRLATSISLFSMVDDNELGIQMRSVLTEDQIVPLGFHTFVDENQTYTISLGDMEGELITNTNVFLQDNMLNTVTNLSETDYTFTADVGYQYNRFVLVFEMDVLGNQELSLEAVSIYPVPTASLLTISSPLAKVNSVAIHDISGRQVAFYNFTDQNSYQMDVTSLDSAVYFVEINTDNGSVTKRIIKE